MKENCGRSTSTYLVDNPRHHLIADFMKIANSHTIGSGWSRETTQCQILVVPLISESVIASVNVAGATEVFDSYPIRLKIQLCRIKDAAR